MQRTHTVNLHADPIRVGQLREDKFGGRIRITRIAASGRYVCTYPRLEDRIITLGERTIEDVYPTVIAG